MWSGKTLYGLVLSVVVQAVGLARVKAILPVCLDANDVIWVHIGGEALEDGEAKVQWISAAQ